MSKLQSLRVFLNDRLTAADVEIFGTVEKTVVEYQEENDRLRRLLRIRPEIQRSRIESLQLSVSEEEVPPEQQHCEQEWSPNLGQENPEPIQIKEEEEELRTSQEEEQFQGLFDNKYSIFTPSCVKSECDQMDPPQEAILAEYPTLSPLNMSKLQLLRVFLNDRLTAAAVEISGAFEKTVVEYQEENDRLRRLLRITPEIQLCRIDSLQLSVSEEEVPPEQQHCEQEWSPSLGQENQEPIQIKEEEEEVRTSQEEEQFQGLFDTKDSIFTPSCVKSECDLENPLQSLTLPQTQTVENRESDSKPLDLKPFGTVTHLKGLYIPCDPPDNQNNPSSHSSAVSSDPVRLDSSQLLDSSPTLDRNPPMGEHCPKPSTKSRNSHRCCDCGETFALKADLQRHVTLTKKRYNSTCKLKAHVRLCHGGKPCTCPVCGKTFKQKRHMMSRHMRIHTGEKPFSCGDCGKSFNLKGSLTEHILTHTGEKPFSCSDCGKCFSRKTILINHKRTHTGEKPFSCGDCGKSFNWKVSLTAHKLTHTGEKPFICGDCGKSFSRKGSLTEHILTHTGEKPFPCGDCGKSFSRKGHLYLHKLTHTGEKPFSCGDCGKSFNRKGSLTAHKLTHTGEKPFICGDCGKSFNRKGHLSRHKLTHTAKKSYSCGDCGERFYQKGNLTDHIRTHTGEKPFSCGDCGKRFYQKGNLTDHIRTHTGEKPFSCGDCGKSFNLKGNLRKHKLTHTGEKPFSCGDCGKSFNRKRDLRRHKLTHTGEKQHGCSVCGKIFTHKSHLLRHVDKVHKERKQDRN